MYSFLNRLLNLYNLSNDDYLNLTRKLDISDLEDYKNFLNIDIALKRVFDAIDHNEKIMIYGDYDCDGITSTSILVRTFNLMNYKNIGYYIPSRYLDGYGINVEMVNLISSKGYKVIITVDNGVAQFDALIKAKELGIDVIILDHHEIKEQLPENYTIVHPSLKKDGNTLPQCGAYVAFNFSRGLLNRVDPYLLTLASLATISDMMPLVSYNRDIVRLGLEIAKKEKYYPFELLLDNKGIEDEKSFSFIIAPKINALGRVLENHQVNKGVEFFVSDDLEKVHEVSNLIDFVNSKRKVISNEAFKKIDFSKYENKTFVIDRFDDVCEGLIGLIANKVLNEVNKPCIIFTKDKKTGLLKGSARSLEGLPLSEILSKLQDEIVQFGGHAFAGGISLEESKLSSFEAKINEIAKNYDILPKKKLIIECEVEDFNIENYHLIRSLSPYGEGFEEPYLSLRFPLKNSSYISNGKHLKGVINSGCSFIHFNTKKNYGKCGFVTLIGKLKLDTYKNKDNLSFAVEEILEDEKR